MAKRTIRPEDLLCFIFVGDPQWSPSGDRVLFARKHISEKNKYVTNLFTVDRDGQVVQWTQGEQGAGHGRWSPDGGTIAFIGGRDKPGSQIYTLSTQGGEARKLTSLPEGSIGGFQWSPDGTKIAFTFRESTPGRTEKDAKEREEKGLSTPPWEIEDIWYRLDGDGYFGGQRYKLYVLDFATGEHRLLSDAAKMGEYSFDWAPNSAELVVIRSAAKRPMFDPADDRVYRLDLAGRETEVAGPPPGDKSAPRWSPDGRWIAFGGDEDPLASWGTRNKRLYVVPAEGGECRCLDRETEYDLSVATLSDSREASYDTFLQWAPDSSGIYLQIGWHGEVQLGYAPLTGGITLLTEGKHALTLGNLSPDGRSFAATYGHPTMLPEVALIEPELGTGRMVPRVLTGFNADFHADVQLSEPEEYWLDSTPNDDGTPSKVHAWLLRPAGIDPKKQHAAVLEIHGGPHTQYGWTFFHEFQVLAAAGYVVVYTNPRGSKGYGEGYCQAIRGDWGRKDWEDIETTTRWMQGLPFVHSGRMGVMGGSYGGYMTNWVIGHTDAYAGAITDRCVSNFVSMGGNSDFPFNKDGYFKGLFYGDLNDIAELWRQSPIAYFKNVKTPTLIIHSEGDLRCNVEQSEQVFTALQELGVPTRFVRYPSSTSHGMSRSGPPDLRMHRLGEILAWWDKYLA